MNLGIAIRSLRKNKGLNQGEFSTRLGISQGYLSQIENEEKTPSVEMLVKISDTLETPLAVMFWFTLTEQDVPENKRDVYQYLKPSIDNLVNAFFN